MADAHARRFGARASSGRRAKGHHHDFSVDGEGADLEPRPARQPSCTSAGTPCRSRTTPWSGWVRAERSSGGSSCRDLFASVVPDERLAGGPRRSSRRPIRARRSGAAASDSPPLQHRRGARPGPRRGAAGRRAALLARARPRRDRGPREARRGLELGPRRARRPPPSVDPPERESADLRQRPPARLVAHPRGRAGHGQDRLAVPRQAAAELLEPGARRRTAAAERKPPRHREHPGAGLRGDPRRLDRVAVPEPRLQGREPPADLPHAARPPGARPGGSAAEGTPPTPP